MFAPALAHSPLKTSVEPVKCRPENSGWDITASVIVAGSPVTRLITPGGRPASSRTLSTKCALYIASVEGFQTTVLPIKAGAAGRLPAIAVKLKGETA